MPANDKPPSFPDGLRSRGAQLWTSLGQTIGTPAGDLALEACRTADRLDELDAIIAGKGVLPLLMFRTKLDIEELAVDASTVTVKIEVSNVLAEARQQGQALKNLLSELGVSRAGKSGPAPTPVAANGLDELAGRRAGRS